jgi:hypothetical protein
VQLHYGTRSLTLPDFLGIMLTSEKQTGRIVRRQFLMHSCFYRCRRLVSFPNLLWKNFLNNLFPHLIQREEDKVEIVWLSRRFFSTKKCEVTLEWTKLYNELQEPGSSVSVVSRYVDDRGSIPGRGERIFPLASVSRPALRPTQPPVQGIPWVLSSVLERGQGVTLTTHPHLVPRSWMSRNYTSSPP